MKVLLISDNHLMTGLEMTILSEDADVNIHLGDSQFMKNNIEIERFDYAIRGNCDFERYPEQLVVEINNQKWLLFHGYQVSNAHDLEDLADYAIAAECSVICYGHTHIPIYSKVKGVTILNPGSFARSRCRYPNSYMTVDINQKWTVQLKQAPTGNLIKELTINE